MKTILAVLMLVVSSAASFAADNNLEVPYNLEGGAIEVDADARPVHVQAVVANLRQRTSEVFEVANAAAEGTTLALDASEQALTKTSALEARVETLEGAESAGTPWWVYLALVVLFALVLAGGWLWRYIQGNRGAILRLIRHTGCPAPDEGAVEPAMTEEEERLFTPLSVTLADEDEDDEQGEL